MRRNNIREDRIVKRLHRAEDAIYHADLILVEIYNELRDEQGNGFLGMLYEHAMGIGRSLNAVRRDFRTGLQDIDIRRTAERDEVLDTFSEMELEQALLRKRRTK